MKKKLLKFLILIILTIIFSANSLTVSADNTKENDISKTNINPLYADIINIEDLQLSQEQPSLLSSDIYYFATLQSAQDYIMERIAARDTQIAFTTAGDYSADEVYSLIKRHTGNPVGGDYLTLGYTTCGLHRSKKDGIYTYTLTITYYTNASQEMEMTDKLNKVMSGLDLDGLTDYQKVISIYDYICKNVAYDYEHLNDNTYLLKFSPYAALVNGKAAAQGYASLFYRMCLTAGIDARCILGTNHAWNIVCIDGKYYNVDTTWDAGKIDYSYFLKCDANFKDHIRKDEYNTPQFNAAHPMSETDYLQSIDWDLNDNGVLTIKGPGVMPSVSPWAGNNDIKEVFIERVTAIKGEAFADCGNITKISADSWLKSIGENAFGGCTSLEAVKLNSAVDMGWKVFAGCISLESFEIPQGTAKIPYKAFDGCVSLKDIVIPDSVKNIDMNAFSNCRALERIVIPDGVNELTVGVFTGCVSLKSAVLPDSVTSISDSAFYQCTGLESICIPSGVIEIGNWAFASCINLKNVVLPAQVERIGENAFYDCRNLEKIYIPKSVEEIGKSAFKDCKNLTVYGYENSYAEKYAIDNGLAFYTIEGIPGDVNSDGNFDHLDLTMVLNSIKDIIKLTPEQKNAADFYGEDGTVDIRDYCALYRLLGGGN